MRIRVLFSAVALLAGVACTNGGSTNPTTTAPRATTTTTTTVATTTTTLPNETFTSNGTQRDGWYWLDAAGSSARWEVRSPAGGFTGHPLAVQAVVAGSSISPQGFGTVSLQIGAGDTVLATRDATVAAAPVVDHSDLALLDGSVPLDDVSIPADASSIWVEMATSGAGTLAVRAQSVQLGAAPPPTETVTATPTSATPPLLHRVEGTFATNGDEISGWWWVRDDAHTQYARWDFAAVPNLADGVTAELYVLATDRVNGGPGVNARFYLTYGFVAADGSPLASTSSGLLVPPPQTATGKTVLMLVRNTSPPDDKVGYTAQDQFTVTPDQVPAGAAGMWFKASRTDPTGNGEPTSEHVAFNTGSIALLVPATGTQGGDGGDLTANGTITDPDAQADADNQADADANGDLPPGTYHGTLDGETEDWFAFHVNATQIIDVSVSSPSSLQFHFSLLNSGLDLRAPVGAQVYDTAFSYFVARGEAGRFYLRLERQSGSGAYTFTVTVRDSDDAQRHIDAGDTPETAMEVGVGDILGEVLRLDTADVYAIHLAAGQSLSTTLVTLTDQDLGFGLQGDLASVRDDAIAYPDEPAALFVEAVDQPQTITLSIERNTGLGGKYRLRLSSPGLGVCNDSYVDASGFASSGSTDGIFISNVPGWYWLHTEPAAARYQQATWTFDKLPDDSTVRVLFDLAIDSSIPLSAGGYITYGTSSATGATTSHGPVYVSFRAEQRDVSLTGAEAVGEFDIPHAQLSGGDQWWVRLSLADPTVATGMAIAPVGLGVAITNVTVCAAGTVNSLAGLSGPVEPTVPAVSYDPTSHTLSSNVSMFVDPASDIDGDGLNQSWENQAMVLADPVLQLDEEELWQFWTNQLTANFVEVTPWPSSINPRYIVIGYLNTWAYDAGGGPVLGTDLLVFENHRGDSERIWEAWKVIDDQTVQLEWVSTSAHASINDHSGVWRTDQQQCNVGYVADVSVDLLNTSLSENYGYYQVMCDQLQFDGDGRLVMSTSQNKHAMYPSNNTCNNAALAALADTHQVFALEDCGWDGTNDPLGIWWGDDDFSADPRYQGGGRWLFDTFNVGEPGYPLIDHFDDPSSWLGLTGDQVVALTNEYPNEALWSGNSTHSDKFCGGLTAGTELPTHWWTNDIEVPEDCSGVLGAKFQGWQQKFVDAMSSRYRVTLHTGTPTGAGTDEAITIQLFDAEGTQLADRLYYGNLENGATDIVYMPPASSTGGAVTSVSFRRTDSTTTGDWYLGSVTVDDVVSGDSTTINVDQWVHSGAGIQVST